MSDPPASPLLDANLAALGAALGRPVPVAADGRWVRTATVDGVVLQLRTATGALVAAHSRRRPDIEAARLVDEALAGRPHAGFAIVIGAGLGYVLDDLLSRDPATRLLVIEPDPSGLAPWLERRDWREAIAANRLIVLTGPDYRGSERAWRAVDAGEGAPLVLAHPVLVREYPDDVRRAGAIGVRVVADARANAGAEAALAAPYLLNTIENLGVVAREADVDALAGAFTGVPAIVVAAGPSLDRVVDGIAGYADRALLIAVDTALRPLLVHGIAPHFAVAVDPSERNARHLSALPSADGTWLVAEPGVHPRAFPEFAGRTFTFRVGANPPWPWLEAQGIARGTLAAWGSVLVSALDFALRIGARPIEIVGADLAYTGGQPYCRGTAFEEDWAREVRWGSTLAAIWGRVTTRPGAQTQPDADGRPVPTLPHLVAFRDRLLQQIRTAGDGIVNATGGGILHGDGVPVAPLGALVGLAPALPDVRPRIREIHRRSASAARASADGFRALLGRNEASRTFAAMVPGVDGDAITASVARAGEALAAPPTGTALAATPATPLTGTPVWLPEQAAALASLVDAGAIARAPMSPDDAGDEGDAGFDTVLDPARDLLAHASLVTAAPDTATLERELLAVPLPMLLAFTHDARADVERFGARLTRWIAGSQDRSDAADPPFWTTAPPPIDPLPVRAARTRSSDDLARIAVTTLLAWAAGRCGEAGVTTARVAAAIARSWPLVTQDVTRAARVQLALRARDGSRLSWLDDAPLGPLARGLSGTIVRAADPGDAEPAADSLALSIRLELHRGREWVSAGRSLIRGPSRLLSPEPCGQSLYGRPIDAGRAILTRQDGTGSTIIDARGRVTLAPRWPEPILAEGPLDADGTWFAWSMTPPRLLVHDAGNRIVHDIALPFTPISAEVEDDGLRFAALDGVWRWTANGGIVRVVETPPLVAAWTMPGGGLDLAWLPPQDRPRQRTDRHFSWSLEEGLREHAPPPLGPCWSRSVHEGWIAEALPDANLVRISDVSGLRGWVISDYPRTVTWAGGSLVIVISGGEVSLVPGVRAALA